MENGKLSFLANFMGYNSSQYPPLFVGIKKDTREFYSLSRRDFFAPNKKAEPTVY